MNQQRKLDLLLTLFVVCLVLANVLGAKIMEVPLPSGLATPLNWFFSPLIWCLNGGMDILGVAPLPHHFFDVVHVSVGILVFPVTFLVTDIVAEVKGRALANHFVVMGMIALGIVMGITALAVYLPPAARSIDNAAYGLVFGSGVRMIFASMVAYVVAQFHDVWAFHGWKEFTRGRHLWIRNNLSTIVSQFLDSVLFMFVAFYQLTPQYTANFVISLLVPYWIFKVLFALLDTPFCYLGVRWLSKPGAAH